MPKHDIGLPARIDLVLLALLQHTIQICRLDITRVVGICLAGRFSQYNLLSHNATRNHLIKSTSRVNFSRINEKSLILVIPGSYLIVELHVVEIDVFAYLPVDGEVGSSVAEGGGEVGALRSMGYDVERKFSS